LLIVSMPALAHHGAAEYDNTKTVSVKGTVTALRYTNPHVLIVFNVKNDKGELTEWTAESQSPNLLSRRGWSRSTLKPGDEIVVTGHPVKNGVPAMSASKVVFADGRDTPNMGLPADSSK
jgi:DNA/RNA endonuclease YhcR with UshA esterase domain